MSKGATTFRQEAISCYWKYMQVQAEIEVYEEAALAATGGDKRAASVILLNPAEATEKSFAYKSLCGDRDMWMRRAALAAAMAAMP